MNKDVLTLSLTIFRHTFGISLWTKSDPTKVEEKVTQWKNGTKQKNKTEKLDADELAAERMNNNPNTLIIKDMPEEKAAKK